MLLERWFTTQDVRHQQKTTSTQHPSAATPNSISDAKVAPLSKDDDDLCKKMLKDCEMFHLLSGNQIETLAKTMNVRSFERNEILFHQGGPVTSFYLLKDGEIRREFLDPESGRKHAIEFQIKSKSINTMRILSADPAHSTVRCNHDTCTLFEMPRQKLLKVLLDDKPDIGVGIANSLAVHVRETSKKYKTPALGPNEQIIQNMPAVMIAAGIESYYRSALNAQVNRALTGVKSDLFPNMHIQVPARIGYIAGFKGLRAFIDQFDEDAESPYTDNDGGTSKIIGREDDASGKFWRRFAITIAPGVMMTPLSSVLEASNAGHMNKEPMSTRWMRGISARCGREILFGLGLNQLTDYFQERCTFTESPMLRNMAGSLVGGVVSGYLSHVPHNLSTYKLLEPHRSYTDLYKNVFVERSVPPFLERYLAQRAQMQGNGVAVVTYSGPQQAVRFLAATIFPRGLVVRTVQIVGSFIILNGTINYFTLFQQRL